MPDYSNGKIYTIRFRDNDKLIYIGSTIQPLAVRYGGHKRKPSNRKCSIYTFIEDKYNNDWSMTYIELYESFPCKSKEELCKKEGEIIRKFKEDENYDCINIVIAGRTHKEWLIDNEERVKEYSKEYNKINKEKLKEKDKEYYNKNKDKIKEIKREYGIEYYKHNKEDRKEYQNEKIKCQCGMILNRSSLERHLSSLLHNTHKN